MPSNDIFFKKGVNAKDVNLKLWEAIYKVAGYYAIYNTPLVITSLNDSKHMRGSKHYEGNGVDFRTYTLPGGYTGKAANSIVHMIRNAMDDKFDVVLERDHIHLEYDPK